MNRDKILLRVENLSAGYDGSDAVSNVSFVLREGEILCMAGESGCGKSTLIRAILGVHPGLNMLGGRIVFDDLCLNEMPAAQRARLCGSAIGAVFQNPGAAFNPIRSYEKQFRETLKSHGKYKRESFPSEIERVFSALGLQDTRRILKSCPYEMSGGMNQRIALAVAMLMNQRLLLADEPTSALDATIQLQVARELKRLRDESSIAQIVVTHNLALAQYLADSIGIMYAGRLVEYGPADRVIQNPLHPYTKSLIESVPGLNGELPAGLDGHPPAEGPAQRGCEFMDRCSRACGLCAEYTYSMTEVEPGHFVSCILAHKE